MADDSYNVSLVLDAENRVSQTVGTVSRDLGQIDRAIDNVNRQNTRLQQGLQGVQTLMRGAFAGLSLNAVIGVGREMYELGTQVHATNTTFEQLSGGAESATRNLELMRQATGGIVSDMDLAAAANRLFMTGLASTGQEAAKLTEIAVKLGGAVGSGPAEAIEQLNAALLNNSYERLDALGISAANVRQRVEELKQSGMDMSAAFAQAVMEQGAQAIERLGEAANEAETPVARLTTRWENLKAALSENVAIGVDATLGLIEATMSRAEDSARVYEMASQMFDIPYDTAAGGLIGGVNPFTQAQLDAARAVLNQLDQMQADAAVAADDAQAAAQQAEQAAAEAQRRQLQNQALDRYQAITGRYYEAYGQYNEIGTNAAGMQEWQFSREYVSTAEAEQLRDLANEAAGDFEYMQGLFDQGLINESALNTVKAVRDLIDETADNAERAAQAFENMSLSQALGEGSGSPLSADLASSFLDSMRGLELPTAQFQELQDTIMLASGQISEASLTYRDDVIPLLQAVYDRFGAGAAADALANVEAFLRDANLQGMTPEQIAAGLPRATGYGFTGGGTSFTVNPGDTPLSVAAAYGLTVDQVLAGSGAANAYSLMPGTYGAGVGGVAALNTNGYFSTPYATATVWENMPDATEVAGVVDPLKEMGDTLSKAAEDTTAIADALDAINGKEITIKVDLMSDAPKWLMDAIAAAVRDNGGSVPGATGRGRQQPYAG